MKTIIAAFSDQTAAQNAINFLNSKGVTDAQLMSSNAGGDMMSTFRTLNVPEERAQIYSEVMRRGALLIVAHVEDDARSLAHDLDKMGSLDLDQAASRWRESGWTGYDASAGPFDATASATERSALVSESGRRRDSAGARDLDVIEERVTVGKREVSKGGVRVRTSISERPVEEQVQLTEERIDIQRERVDEAISPNAADAGLTEDEFVVTARGEEAVVGKEARIVERVHVGKQADTRTETIRETERRRDVEVEPIEETRDRRR
ncbi:MAG TPA: YsnF/AvaK domain-containing protein [Kofleriaceae bacterium]|nr:YsnF/AvaK domain-containing protein [Kofleriaceae bacterium]